MSLLIKGVQVVDGTGKPPYKADVLVQRNIISAIGNLKRKKAQREIDGLGNYLTPGFIDVNNTADHYLTLFTDPSQADLATQGVTTIIGGQCGASLAPLVYGSLESIRKWADPGEINVNWHTVSEFLETLGRLPLGINFSTLAGHSTIRRAIVGENDRHLTVKELAVFQKLLNQSLKEGAFGFSSGLGYVHGKLATPKEIKTLVKTVADFGGVYSTHLRSYSDELLDSVKEIIKVAKDTGVKTIINHFLPLKGQENQFNEVLQLLEKSAAKASVYFDIRPTAISIQAIYTLLPQTLQKRNLEKMLAEIQDKRTTTLIKKEWQRLNIKEIQVASTPHHPYLHGRTIEDADDLLNLMIATRLRATVLIPNINEEVLAAAFASSRAFIASSGIPENTFLKYFEITVKEGRVSIEQAVKKITSDPATYFGIRKRGVLKERNIADLVIVGKNDYKPRQTILGGRIVGEDKIQGEVLRHKR